MHVDVRQPACAVDQFCKKVDSKKPRRKEEEDGPA